MLNYLTFHTQTHKVFYQHLPAGLSYYGESMDMNVPLILHLHVQPESMEKQTGIQFTDKWAHTIYSNTGFYYPNDVT